MVVALNRPFIDPDDDAGRAGQAAALRALAERVAPTTLARDRTLPVLPALAGLLGPSGPAERENLGPSGAGLRRGATATVAGGRGLGATSLAFALVAAATQAGSWAAVVGLPAAHAPAAAHLGVALERLALVPEAATLGHWPTVVAALLDGVDLVVAAVPAGLRAPDARRLVARARERGSVLIPLLPAGASWVEGADVRLQVVAATWHGLEAGHGFLQARQVEVAAAGRGAAGRPRSVRLWLPGHDGVAVAEAAEPTGVPTSALPGDRKWALPQVAGAGRGRFG
ncbi:MAG: hypothetical protein ABIS47_13435 [Acidimicrobiales bacterium]